MSMITRFCSSSHRQEDTTDRLSIVDTPVNRQVGHHGSFFALVCGIGIGTYKRCTLSLSLYQALLIDGRVYAELVCRLFFQEDRRWDKIFHKKIGVTTSLLIPTHGPNWWLSLRAVFQTHPKTCIQTLHPTIDCTRGTTAARFTTRLATSTPPRYSS